MINCWALTAVLSTSLVAIGASGAGSAVVSKRKESGNGIIRPQRISNIPQFIPGEVLVKYKETFLPNKKLIFQRDNIQLRRKTPEELETALKKLNLKPEELNSAIKLKSAFQNRRITAEDLKNPSKLESEFQGQRITQDEIESTQRLQPAFQDRRVTHEALVKALQMRRNPEEIKKSLKNRWDLLNKRRGVLKDLGEGLIKMLNKTDPTSRVKVLATYPLAGIQRLKVSQGQSIEGLFRRLKEFDAVEDVERNYKVKPLSHMARPPDDEQWFIHQHPDQLSPHVSNLWGLERIGMKDAWPEIQNIWNGTLEGEVVIAIIDTGLDTTHPDLAENLWTNPNEMDDDLDNDGNCYKDDIHGVNLRTPYSQCETQSQDNEYCDYFQDEGVLFDETAHGTVVAGIIAAFGNNQSSGNEEKSLVGVNWKAKIMSVKIFCIEYGTIDRIQANDPNDPVDQLTPPTSSSVGNAIDAIGYAVTMGATIINNSWVIDGLLEVNDVDLLRAAISNANDAGVLFVAGAGNEGTNNAVSPHSFPASFALPNLVAVAATGIPVVQENQPHPFFDAINTEGALAALDFIWTSPAGGSNFSNGIGPNEVGAVHIAAPGWKIRSTKPPSSPLTAHAPFHPALPPSYVSDFIDGTSMATPFVTGCAALLQNFRSEHSLPLLSPSEIKEILTDSGDQPSSLANFVVDGRRLNCHRALQRLPICQGCDSSAPSAPTNLRVN